ncbi:SCF ubiquitin ligase complex subunit cdc4, partial [Spiromyces aspiralis]
QHGFQPTTASAATVPSAALTPSASYANSIHPLHSLKSVLSAYDTLPSNMQSYILFQFLRRTPREVLQFTTQTVLPALKRDFLGELPSEISTRILRFMDTKTLGRASCVNRRWNRVICTDREAWRAQLVKDRFMHPVNRLHPKALSRFKLGEDRPPTILEGYVPPLTDSYQNMFVVDEQLADQSRAFEVRSNPFREAYRNRAILEHRWRTNQCRLVSFSAPPDVNTVTTIKFDEKYLIVGFDNYDTVVYCIKTGKMLR